MFNWQFGPPRASAHAVYYDALFWTITGLTIIFTAIVFLLVLVLAIRYRRGTKVDRRNPMEHNTMLELSWTVLPLILALGIFAWSTKQYLHVRTMPEDATDIFVIGKQWMWHIQHMDGTRENNELHIPVGKPIKMTMISQDVLHAMYLPDFRAQYHVVPGRYTQLTFTPTVPGKYKMLCAMHCGTQHSEMVGYVYVLSQGDYAEWLDKGGIRTQPKEANTVDYGKRIWETKKCATCHGPDDTVRGPSLVGIPGRERVFENGSRTTATEDYLRLSIMDPHAQLTKGYDPTMPIYKGQLTEEDVLALIAYIKSLGGSPSTGGLKPYERPDAPGSPTFSAPDNATDRANRSKSAGVSQAEGTKFR
jgi:cytochrome c oxidase subunit 2